MYFSPSLSLRKFVSPLIVFILSGLSSLMAQSVEGSLLLKGRITGKDGEPIPYVNIGILGKNAGTVCDARGRFEFSISKIYQADTLQFSCIGYGPESFPVNQYMAGRERLIEIELKPRFQSLPEMMVRPRTSKSQVLGNTSKSKFMSGGFSSSDLGAEAGTRIKIKRRPSILEAVNFHISYNRLDSVKVRLNIYAMHGNKPAENILPENIILSIVHRQTGEIHIDLTKYNLVVMNDILVAFEMIEGKGDLKNSIFLSASLWGSPTYYRQASHDQWKTYKTLSIGINVRVRN